MLNGLSFPGDVMATINTSTQSITSTVNLETGTDTMGQLVSDGTLRLRLGHRRDQRRRRRSEPEPRRLRPGQPALRHRRRGHLARARAPLGPPPTETGLERRAVLLGGRRRGRDLRRPSPCRPTSSRSARSAAAAERPAANTGGDCREVPDVSADADPSTGYVIYDTVNGLGLDRPGRDERRRAAVGRRARRRRLGRRQHGRLRRVEPALYLLAQQSPGTYLNDVTSGNNDYNATDGGQFPAMTGYDMATGLGTPVASALASGLTAIPLDVVVSGTQAYGGSPTFTRDRQLRGLGQRALRRHAEHERPQLHRGRLLDDHRSVPARRAATRCWPPRAAASRSRAPTAPTTRRRLHERRERLHRHARPGRRRGLGQPDLRGHADLRRHRQPAVRHHREHVGAELHPGGHARRSRRPCPPAATRLPRPRAAGPPCRAPT